ncbi:type III secretion system ATPase, FliI/YscN [Magnetococcus marinus MC-1]|uniref:Type III secretion system ATPase, FliI/YscN n=1 Tax=Magnetococcus marinus (strain ATCC BAA-1437 / JCM 17883 / MC-1) TaxID=156889 RepID=A0L4A6_MAGMM|nr:FliI/YscN family ATPase [Magnetococcus marinus]ABK42799.1 type III secretion system ATPase, FliI/YscN [Magnetococcus marinus MC-1]
MISMAQTPTEEHPLRLPWGAYAQVAQEDLGFHRLGWVKKVVGLLIEGNGPAVSIGQMCDVVRENGEVVKAEVVGFRDKSVLLMPLGSIKGIFPGSRIISQGRAEQVPVGPQLLGRVIGPMGEALDGHALPHLDDHVPLHAAPINPMLRRKIEEPLDLGVRAVNSLLTVGRGQRLGIFAGTGVGKSTLLGMMARYTAADINVIALIGERGREVVEFIEDELGPEGMARSIVIVATSDQPPLLRLRAAYMATAIAEFFRAQQKDVLLLMDSITRFAMAQREVGLATGEPPTSRGYPPSTFMLLPRLLERGGRDQGRGSITSIYTVLMEGDDIQDPIVDAVRGILDGHIVLSRDLAAANHYPAIDVNGSLSRLMEGLSEKAHKRAAGQLREILATYVKAEDMINIGAYVAGSNPRIDRAIRFIEPIRTFLKQSVEEPSTLEESIAQLESLFA